MGVQLPAEMAGGFIASAHCMGVSTPSGARIESLGKDPLVTAAMAAGVGHQAARDGVSALKATAGTQHDVIAALGTDLKAVSPAQGESVGAPDIGQSSGKGPGGRNR